MEVQGQATRSIEKKDVHFKDMTKSDTAGGLEFSNQIKDSSRSQTLVSSSKDQIQSVSKTLSKSHELYGLEHNDPQEQENRPQLPKKSGLIELTNPDFGFSPFYQRLADNNRVNLEESVEAVMIKQRNHQFGQLSFSFQNLNDNKLKDFKGSMNEILISELRKNAAA